MNDREHHLHRQIIAGAAPYENAPWTEFLRKRGTRAWLVGGTLRDLAWGLAPLDIDLAVEDDAFELGQKLAEAIQGRFIPLHEQFGACRIILSDGVQIDLTQLQGSTIEEDLFRRDLTINAIATIWPAPMQIIDPCGGLHDLAEKIARTPAPGNLMADPVRALRVFRFAAQFDLAIAPETLMEIPRASRELPNIPGERIWVELRHILSRSPAARWIEMMNEYRILDALFPELAKGAGVWQPAYHHLDVHGHSILTVCQLDSLFDDPILGPVLADPQARVVARMAAIFHDLAKPDTASGSASGPRYPQHARAGGDLADQACRRLRLPNDERERVVSLVVNHMRPHQLADLLAVGKLSLRATRKFLLDLGADWPLCIALARADLLSASGPLAPQDGAEKSRDLARHLAEAAATRLPPNAKKTLITGHDVLALGLPPGPEIGRLIEAIEQERFDNPALTKDQALRMLQQMIRPPSMPHKE